MEPTHDDDYTSFNFAIPVDDDTPSHTQIPPPQPKPSPHTYEMMSLPEDEFDHYDQPRLRRFGE